MVSGFNKGEYFEAIFVTSGKFIYLHNINKNTSFDAYNFINQKFEIITIIDGEFTT